jgi:hypothetical protein
LLNRVAVFLRQQKTHFEGSNIDVVNLLELFYIGNPGSLNKVHMVGMIIIGIIGGLVDEVHCEAEGQFTFLTCLFQNPEILYPRNGLEDPPADINEVSLFCRAGFILEPKKNRMCNKTFHINSLDQWFSVR